MTQNDKTFTIVDPRTFDGDPYDVAARAVLQAEAVTRIAAGCVEQAATMARNAQLERNLYTTKGEDAKASEWEDSAQSRQFSKVHIAIKGAQRALIQLSKAAAYDPKNPPKA
jgi:hypothetical protein